MFKRKNSIVELQKEKVVVNMVLIVTNQNKTMTHEDLKEKNLENQNLKELDGRGKVSTIFWNYYLRALGNQFAFIITRGT